LQKADAVRAKLRELGITERDVAEAVKWARRRR
jgi:cysteinyl-tRNA synthetase